MERYYMFGHNSLRLPLFHLIWYLQEKQLDKQKSQMKLSQRPKLTPISDLCNGWQGFFDIQTHIITPYHDLNKLDEKDWARYFSGLVKGKHILFPGAVETMWEKVKTGSQTSASLEAHVSKLLIECLKGHHAGDPLAAIAMSFQVRLFLSGKLAREEIKTVLQNLRSYSKPLLTIYEAELPSLLHSITELIFLNDSDFSRLLFYERRRLWSFELFPLNPHK